MRALNPHRILGMVLAAGILAACHADRSEEAVAAPAVPAEVITVAAEPATVYATVPGTVVSKRHAEIASRLTGYVQDVKVQAGDRVTAGQPLLAIDSSEVTGQLQQAQAVFDEADLNYQRATNLYSKGVATRVQMDDATRQYSTAKAALQIAQAAVGYADVRAPFTGVVVEKLADPGDLATPGKPLLVLEDEHALEVQSYVPDELYAALKVGEDIPYATESGSYQGRLQSKVQAADAQTHTHLIRIEVSAGSGLMSGRYVRVSIPTGSAQVVRIPASALAERAGILGVFVVDADGQAHFRLVRTGERRDRQVEVQSGLAAGERVVLAPGDQVDNGTRIAAGGAMP
ncbi:MAG TPA: efflux RND transporter periplasmic adaptor subunit [Gammaproteobacteria bacterium]|jgi:RND family efflux transporter MFP subunit|nr:efflux RND transporter periplasmic adaptor subunit [Gammaproteobacteria bacterium]